MSEHKRPQQYAYLEQLSLEELKGIIRADAESEENEDTDFIYAVLEVMEEKERALPGYQPVNVDRAWAEFQQHYNTREGRNLSLYPMSNEDQAKLGTALERPRLRVVRRSIVVVAAAVGLIFALMLTVQAAGLDVFGVIAQWTDDVFSFTWTGHGTPERPEWAETLIEQGVDANLIPTEIPDGYEPGELIIDDFGFWKEFYQPFRSEDDELLYISIIFYSSSEYLQISAYEKDESLVEICEYNQGKIYSFSNATENKVAYLDGLTEVCVTGNFSLEKLQQILKSIGGIDL